MSAEEVGKRLCVTAETVRLWALKGIIPSVRVTPKVVRFEWADVLAALRRRKPSDWRAR
jgi:DNA-binding transcriptional MerR regulator